VDLASERKEMTETGSIAGDEHVLNADGHVEVHDAPVDLSIYRFEDWIAFAFFWVLALAILHRFLGRYELNVAVTWTEEIARYLLICTVFIGAAIGVRKDNHIQVDSLCRIFPQPLMRLLSTVVDGLRIALFACAAYLACALLRRIGVESLGRSSCGRLATCMRCCRQDMC
jgi:TRAP-type transport system small permease protein